MKNARHSTQAVGLDGAASGPKLRRASHASRALASAAALAAVISSAQQAGAQGRIDPVVALWTPLVFLSALIFWMYHVLAHRPGGQPIAALERAFARVGKMVRAAVPRPRDGRAEAA